MKCCKRCVVSGRVQGVFFRHATQQQAIALGIKGWIRNLENGDVECVVCGDESAVTALCRWLYQGPPAAKVEAVEIEEIASEIHEDFMIIR